MKYGMTCNPYHASSVRPDASEYVFTLSGGSCTPSLRQVRFRRIGYFVSLRGADGHAIGVVSIVVIVVAVAVHIVEIVLVVSGAEPPVRGAT